MTGGRTNIPLLKTDLGIRGLGERVALFNSKGDLVGHALKSDFYSTGGGSSSEYSLEEKLYGVWINGENMYRKCFEINIDSLKEGAYSTDSSPYKLYHNLGVKDIKEGYLIKFIENTVNSTINFKDLIISGGDSEYLNLDCLDGLTSDWILILEYTKVDI